MAGAVGPRPAPTLRLLCLHGRGTDGAGLERAMEEAQQQANLPSVAFEFLDAPYASGAPPSAPLDDAPAGASARCWWRERWNDLRARQRPCERAGQSRQFGPTHSNKIY